MMSWLWRSSRAAYPASLPLRLGSTTPNTQIEIYKLQAIIGNIQNPICIPKLSFPFSKGGSRGICLLLWFGEMTYRGQTPPLFLKGKRGGVTSPPYGGDERTRTADPLRARQVLSQLSYIPNALDGAPSMGSDPAVFFKSDMLRLSL
jgi:hypothetical protein